LEKKK